MSVENVHRFATIVIVVAGVVGACSVPTPTVSPLPTPTAVSPLPTPEPTATTGPTPTPPPIPTWAPPFVTATSATPSDTPTATLEPTATRTPAPTPTPTIVWTPTTTHAVQIVEATTKTLVLGFGQRDRFHIAVAHSDTLTMCGHLRTSRPSWDGLREVGDAVVIEWRGLWMGEPDPCDWVCVNWVQGGRPSYWSAPAWEGPWVDAGVEAVQVPCEQPTTAYLPQVVRE